MDIAISNLLCKYDYLFSDSYYVIYEEVDLYGNNYLDITKEWINNAKPNSHKVKNRHYFEYDNIKYRVDNKNVVLDYSDKEKEVAIWLENTFGGEIYMLPRINNPKGIQTADYLFRREYWDLKTLSENAISEIRAVDNIIKTAKKQTNNIILDITNSILPRKNIINQVERLYMTKGRNWIDKIILIDNYELIKIFKKNKKEVVPPPSGVGKTSM